MNHQLKPEMMQQHSHDKHDSQVLVNLLDQKFQVTNQDMKQDKLDKLVLMVMLNH